MTKCTVIRIVIAALSLAAAAASAQTDAQRAFATIKSLPGTWEGDTQMGPVKVTFKTTAGGSAVMSEILGKEDMVTMFNLDGPGRLLMTHWLEQVGRSKKWDYRRTAYRTPAEHLGSVAQQAYGDVFAGETVV